MSVRNHSNQKDFRPNPYYSSLHNTEEMRVYTEELWLSGMSVHVLEKMLEKKLRNFSQKK